MAKTPAEHDGDVQVVHEFPVSDRDGAEMVRASIQTYKGERYVHVRRWYVAETDGVDDELRPGKGLALRLSLLPELKRAVVALEEAANAS